MYVQDGYYSKYISFCVSYFHDISSKMLQISKRNEYKSIEMGTTRP
jgi:hypothetical protein